MSRVPLTDVERIKADSKHLRGTIVDSLADPLTGALAADDTQLSKFHGFYQQDDRDLRSERKRQRLEPAYSFMLRARVPAGICSTEQWLTIDRLATTFANGTIRLTTRQAIQLHGVIKRDLKKTIAGINDSDMTITNSTIVGNWVGGESHHPAPRGGGVGGFESQLPT